MSVEFHEFIRGMEWRISHSGVALGFLIKWNSGHWGFVALDMNRNGIGPIIMRQIADKLDELNGSPAEKGAG